MQVTKYYTRPEPEVFEPEVYGPGPEVYTTQPEAYNSERGGQFYQDYPGVGLLPWHAQVAVAVCSGLILWVIEVLLTYGAQKVGQYLLRRHHTGNDIRN